MIKYSRQHDHNQQASAPDGKLTNEHFATTARDSNQQLFPVKNFDKPAANGATKEETKPLHHCTSAIRNRTYYD